RISVWATYFISFTGIAKPRPLALSDSDLLAVLMPITSDAMLSSGPPELPWLIDASVCTASMTVLVSESSPDSGTARCSALTIPWVSVLRRPSGAPAAITGSPTRSLSASPSRATVRLSTLSTLSTATSVSGSRPTRWAGACLPSLKTTVSLNLSGLSAAWEITWLLVTMYPRPSTTTPDPWEPSSSLIACTVTTESPTAAATFAICPVGSWSVSVLFRVILGIMNAWVTSAVLRPTQPPRRPISMASTARAVNARWDTLPPKRTSRTPSLLCAADGDAAVGVVGVAAAPGSRDASWG